MLQSIECLSVDSFSLFFSEAAWSDVNTRASHFLYLVLGDRTSFCLFCLALNISSEPHR